MQKTFITDISERDFVDTLFLVREKVTAMAKNGKPYLNLKLADKSGEIDGRLWDNVDEYSALFQKGDILRFKGKTTLYIGKMQLIIQKIEQVDESIIDLGDFMPVSSRSRDDMVDELKGIIDSLENPHLKSLMMLFYQDEQFLKRYSMAPAAKTMHHAYIGGLIEHSLAVAALASDITKRYPELNSELVIVGALLHDIGKTEELSFERTFDYTDTGRLLGHITIGVEMIDSKIRELNDFPFGLKTMLKHLLLSHHGEYEYGSPKRPKTLEAIALSYVDDLDSKINGIGLHIEKNTGEDDWTNYNRFYERYFFAGDLDQRDKAKTEITTPAQTAPPTPAPAQTQQTEKPTPKKEERPKPKEMSRHRRDASQGGFTLGEQLKEKNLDLFGSDEGK